jgi:hypothetical protein
MKQPVRIFLLLGISLLHASCREEPKPAHKEPKTDAQKPKPTDSQSFMGGYVMDEASYGDAADPADVQENKNSLPSSASLESDCPPVANQQYRTCLAWSLSEARSILYKRATGQALPFSTGYLYALSKEAQDVDCKTGLRFKPTLEKLQQMGIIPQSDLADECVNAQSIGNQPNAALYRIKNHDKVRVTNDCKPVKRCLADGKPVAFGMKCLPEFRNCKTAVWNPTNEQAEYQHAMLAVGYDDNKEGGAIRVMNSWGKDWGENGFIWIRYADFVRFVKEAWAIAAEESAQITADAELGGNIEFQRTANAQKLTVVKEQIADQAAFQAVYKDIRVADIPKNYWCIKEPLRSGSQFEMSVQNQVGCYMYAFATGASKQVDVLFPNQPNRKRVNAFVAGGKTVRLPAGAQAFTLDDKIGTDMMCILYSKNRLNVDEMAQKMQQQHRNMPFIKAVETVLGSQLIQNENVTFGSGKTKGIQSKDKKGQVLMVMVAVQHVK